MIESVRTDASSEGKVYCIPYSFENITFNWRVDYFNAVGAKEAPATWDDWYRIAKELQTWGKDQKIVPTSFVGALWTDIGALICSSMKSPYTAEGLINWEAPEAIESLAFYKKLVSEGLTPTHGFLGRQDRLGAGAELTWRLGADVLRPGQVCHLAHT
jgi:ABC-type glycerol-3-phosphate transport system substrate-binding protein